MSYLEAPSTSGAKLQLFNVNLALAFVLALLEAVHLAFALAREVASTQALIFQCLSGVMIRCKGLQDVFSSITSSKSPSARKT